jgi:hypothetical protein
MKRDVLKRYRNSGFTLTTWDTHRTDNMGKSILGYRLADRGTELFQGEDFRCSPMHAIDSLHTVEAILSFLTLKPGDTDADYFDSYTPAQIEWCHSARCEELNMIQLDLEERLNRKR